MSTSPRSSAPTRTATTRRWRRSGRGSTPSSRTRRPRRALKPWYRQLCKRPCFHDEYLQAYNRPNVHLVDTDGAGVERIDETGVWVGDEHYELDCLIFASGFEVGTEYARRAGLRDRRPRRAHAVGEVGRRHAVVARRARARIPEPVPHHAGAGRQPHLEHHEQPRGVGRGRSRAWSRHALDVGADEVEVTEEAERGWIAMLEATRGRSAATRAARPATTTTRAARSTARDAPQHSGYPMGPVAFFEFIDGWRTDGDVRRASSSAPPGLSPDHTRRNDGQSSDHGCPAPAGEPDRGAVLHVVHARRGVDRRDPSHRGERGVETVAVARRTRSPRRDLRPAGPSPSSCCGPTRVGAGRARAARSRRPPSSWW